MSAIEIKNLTYVYSPKTPFEKVALSDINLTIEEGQFVGIVGATGSGKSTLIQHLNGLVKVQDKMKSSVVVNGMSATDKKTLKNLRFEVGMVFQYPEYQLFADTVEKDVAFGPKNMKLEKDEIDRRVRRAIEVVGLDYDTFAHRSPFDLSGAQNSRPRRACRGTGSARQRGDSRPCQKTSKRGFSDGDYGVAQHGRHCGDR